MTHVREQLRDAAATLATGLATTGANVFTTQLHSLEQAELPCWIVATPSEISERDDTGSLMREVDLVFSGFVRGTSGGAIDDTLDTMAEELETVMVAASLAGAAGLSLVGTEFDYDVDESDQAFGMVELTFRCTYYTAIGAPGVAI